MEKRGYVLQKPGINETLFIGPPKGENQYGFTTNKRRAFTFPTIEDVGKWLENEPDIPKDVFTIVEA